MPVQQTAAGCAQAVSGIAEVAAPGPCQWTWWLWSLEAPRQGETGRWLVVEAARRSWEKEGGGFEPWG